MALILLWRWTKQNLFCIWFDLYLYPSTQSSLPGTPWFDLWARGLLCRLDLSQFQWVCQIEAKNNCKVAKMFSFSFFQLLPQCDFGFPSRSSYVASCWEGSYPSSTNLVPQTNFKVLKNSQNLDLWGLKQLLRIHLLCSHKTFTLFWCGFCIAPLQHWPWFQSKKAAFDLFLLKMEHQYYPCHNSHVVFSFKECNIWYIMMMIVDDSSVSILRQPTKWSLGEIWEIETGAGSQI